MKRNPAVSCKREAHLHLRTMSQMLAPNRLPTAALERSSPAFQRLDGSRGHLISDRPQMKTEHCPRERPYQVLESPVSVSSFSGSSWQLGLLLRSSLQLEAL